MHNSVFCFISPKRPRSVNYFSYYLLCDSCGTFLQTWTLTAAQSHPEEGKWEGNADLFFLASWHRMHWNGLKVWQRRPWLDIRKHFSTEIVYFILFYFIYTRNLFSEHHEPIWGSGISSRLDWRSAVLVPKRDSYSTQFSSTFPVLVLVGKVLSFFFVAGTGLWFGFSIRIMLIRQWCFSFC